MVGFLFRIFNRSLLAFLAPYFLLVVGYFALEFIHSLTVNQLATLRLVPYSLFVVSACISLYFGRGRIFYLSLLMTLLHWALTSYYPYRTPSEQTLLLLVLGLIAPLNLAVLSLFRDRGITLVQSYVFASLLGLQYALVVEVMMGDLGPWLLGFDQAYAKLPMLTAIGIQLPNSLLVSLLISSLLISVRIFFRHTPLNNALLVLLVAQGLIFNFVGSMTTVVVLFIVSGLVALLSLLQHSYDMAYRDELTGLLGRRALNERFLRLAGRYIVVMVDVDHFKKFNDNYGHDVGDQVLKMLASQLEKTGGGARAYRYGGEEFVLVFERKSLRQVEPHLEKLRQNVANYPMKVRGLARPNDAKKGSKLRKKGADAKILKVTISLGAAQRSEKMKTPMEVMEAADKALYRAKNAGRNRVVLAAK